MNQGFEAVSLAVFFGALVVAVVAALRLGGGAERAGAILLLLMVAFRFATRALHAPVFASVDPFGLATDLIGFGGFTWNVWHAKRYWPLWAAALQLLSLGGHFARFANYEVEPLVYAVMKSAPTFLASIALLTGTVLHWRRTRGSGRRASRPAYDGPKVSSATR
jgi:hypothetical protein